MVDLQLPSVVSATGPGFTGWGENSKYLSRGRVSSKTTLDILKICYGPELQPGRRIPKEIAALQKGVAQGKTLDQAYRGLTPEQQSCVHAQVGKDRFQRILYLDSLGDAQLTSQYQLLLARQLIHEEGFAPAVGILKILTESPQTPASVKKSAKFELDAVTGQGDVGRRFEFLATQLPREALDFKLILPMMIGTGAFYWSRGFFLDKLTGLSKVSTLTRGYGAEILAGVGALGVEVPAFSFSSRGLRYLAGEPLGPWKQELLGAGITLSLLKFSALLGRKGMLYLHGVDPAGVSTQLLTFTRFNQAVIPQVSMFTGLLAAHRLETHWGLRAPVDGATVMTDTFSSLVSLGIGSRLGFNTYRSLTGRWGISPSVRRVAAGPSAKNLDFPSGWGLRPAPWALAGVGKPGAAKAPAKKLYHLSQGNSGNGSSDRGDYKFRFKEIEVLRLSNHTTRALKRLGMDRVYMLTWFDEFELAKYFFRNDPASVAEIRSAMNRHGFELGSVLEPPQNKFHYLHLGALGLSLRNHKVLQTKLNLRWIEELIKYTPAELQRVSGLPDKSIQEIREALREKGLAFNGEDPNHISQPRQKPVKASPSVNKKAPESEAVPEPEKLILKLQSEVSKLPISKEGRNKLKDRGEINNIRKLVKESEWSLRWVLGLSKEDLTDLKKAFAENNLSLAPKKIPAKLYRWRIWETGISPKTEVALGKLEIYRVADLLKKSRQELKKSPYLLEVHLNEIYEFLEASGLKLRGE